MLPLMAPICPVVLGSYIVTRLHQCEVTSTRLAPVDMARIRLPAAGMPEVTIGMPVTISQGYRESGVWQVFAGTVRRVEPAGDELIITAADPLAPVMQTRVSRSFTGAAPQEIIRWLWGQAGVQNWQISVKRLPALPRFVADGPVGRVLEAINSAWGIKPDCYWIDGRVWWGFPEESPRAGATASSGVVSYGRNMLGHQVEAGGQRGRLLIAAAPIFHSQLLDIEDPRAWPGRRRVRVDRVTYRAKPAQVVIEWSPLAPS